MRHATVYDSSDRESSDRASIRKWWTFDRNSARPVRSTNWFAQGRTAYVGTDDDGTAYLALGNGEVSLAGIRVAWRRLLYREPAELLLFTPI